MLSEQDRRRLSTVSDMDLDIASGLFNRLSRTPYRGMLSQTIPISTEDQRRLNTWAYLSGYYYFRGNKVRGDRLQSNLRRVIDLYRMERFRVYLNDFYTGRIDVDTFERTIGLDIKPIYIAAFLLAVGGINRLRRSTLLSEALIGGLNFHNKRAADFLSQQGIPPSGMVGTWLSQHYRGAANMYYETEAQQQAGAGSTEYRNILGLAERHCTGGGSCVEQSSLGWSPIGSLIPIGSRTCAGNCLCSYEYR